MPPCPVPGCRETRHHWHLKLGRTSVMSLVGKHGGGKCDRSTTIATRCYGAAWQATVECEESIWVARIWNARGVLDDRLFATHAEALAWALREVGL